MKIIAMRIASSVLAFSVCLAARAPEALGNSTLPFVGNACNTDSSLQTAPPDVVLLGRMTVRDAADMVVHNEENVIATRTGQNPSDCLVQFDIHFTPDLLALLLSEELSVELEICGEKKGGVLHASEADACTFDDPAVSVLYEPIDTLADDTLATALASIEAWCEDGEALKHIDPDGDPEFVCTDEFALDSELAAEIAARMSADATLQANIDDEASARMSADATLQANIDAEASARMSADAVLSGRISALEGYDVDCPPGEALVRVDLDGVPGFVCRGYELQTSARSANSSCSCPLSCTTNDVCCCRLSSAVGGGQDPVGCIRPDLTTCSSNCGTHTFSCSDTGSCTAPPQGVSCPTGTELTACNQGTFNGANGCQGDSGASGTCSQTLSTTALCDCSPGLLGCGVVCAFNLSGSQSVSVLSSQAMCGEVVQN